MPGTGSLVAAFLILWAGAAQAGSPVSDPEKRPARESARAFLKAVLATDATKLADLGTDPFSFDGRELSGRQNIKQSWNWFFDQHRPTMKQQQTGQIDLLDYRAMRKRFGAAPKKFKHLGLRHCRFAVVSFEKRAGFLMILSKHKKAGWQVTAMSD